MQRLFANLISNAVYYAASDSVITVQASTVIDTDSVMSNVQKAKQSGLKPHLKIVLTNRLDNPLTQLEADKLSERFYRHHKNNTFHSGTGLGLSIVQAIVDAHNGRMSITVKDSYYFQVSVELLLS